MRLAELGVGHQLGIARGDGHVALGEHHVHVGKRGAEERPVRVHGLQRRQAVGMSRQPGLHRRAEAVPARQHHPALRPAEHPGDGAQILDALLLGARRRTAADVEGGDLLQHGGFAEVGVEALGLVDQRAIGAEGVRRQLLHDGAPGLWHRAFDLQQGRLEGGSGQGLEIAPADLGVGILAADHLALLGDPDLALHGARRLGQDGIVGSAHRRGRPSRRGRGRGAGRPHGGGTARPASARPCRAPRSRSGSRHPCCCRNSPASPPARCRARRAGGGRPAGRTALP